MQKAKTQSKSKKLLGVALGCLVGATGLVTATGCDLTSEDLSNTTQIEYELNADNFVNSDKLSIQVTSGNYDPANGAMTYLLEATVHSADAPDKSVTWGLRWKENNTGDANADPYDYLSLTPNYGGENIAQLQAIKAFIGSSIDLICSTVVGDFKATCTFIYKGTPYNTAFTYAGLEGYSGGNYNLDIGQTYTMDLRGVNYLGVSEEFSEYALESVEFVGEMSLSVRNIGAIGTVMVPYAYDVSSLTQFADDYITASVVNNQLQFTLHKAFESYNGYVSEKFIDNVVNNGLDKANSKFLSNSLDSTTGLEYPYFEAQYYNAAYPDTTLETVNTARIKISVKNVASGLISHIFVDPLVAVTGVTLNHSEIII